MDETVVLVSIAVLFILGLVGFVALMIFFPESVGITGKIAKENLRMHQQEPIPSLKSETDILHPDVQGINGSGSREERRTNPDEPSPKGRV